MWRRWRAAVGSNRYVNWADIMYMVLPSAILVFYFVATRLVVWSDKKQKQSADHWSEASTVILTPPPDPRPGEPAVTQPAAAKTAEPVRWPRYGERPAPAFVLKAAAPTDCRSVRLVAGQALVAAVMSGVMALVERLLGQHSHSARAIRLAVAGRPGWLVGSVDSVKVVGRASRRSDAAAVCHDGIGMGVGVAAFGASEVLLVNLPSGRGVSRSAPLQTARQFLCRRWSTVADGLRGLFRHAVPVAALVAASRSAAADAAQSVDAVCECSRGDGCHPGMEISRALAPHDCRHDLGGGAIGRPL